MGVYKTLNRMAGWVEAYYSLAAKESHDIDITEFYSDIMEFIEHEIDEETIRRYEVELNLKKIADAEKEREKDSVLKVDIKTSMTKKDA